MDYVVNKNEKIQEILNKTNEGDTVFIKNGIYDEKIEIHTNNITIIGESVDGVIIQNHDFYHKIMFDGNECNTFRTFSVYVFADGVKIQNLTIRNTSTPSSKYGQAVALHVDGNNFVAEGLKIESAQDTLFTGPLPENLLIKYQGFHKPYQLLGRVSNQIYKNCTIVGDVDFIFGGAQVLFDRCTIVSLCTKDHNVGYVSAPSHKKESEFGYLFYRCELKYEGELNEDTTVYLGRPWRDYGLAAFIDCSYDKHIDVEGFANWGGTERFNTARFYEYNKNIDTTKRIKWGHMLDEVSAKKYVEEFKNSNDFFKNYACE